MQDVKYSPTSDIPAIPARQSLEPSLSGPKLNVASDTLNPRPPKVNVGVYHPIVSHGTWEQIDQKSAIRNGQDKLV